MKKGKLELTEQEATTLLELINIASKATGLDSVDACKYFKDKIVEAFKEDKIVEEPKIEK